MTVMSPEVLSKFSVYEFATPSRSCHENTSLGKSRVDIIEKKISIDVFFSCVIN